MGVLISDLAFLDCQTASIVPLTNKHDDSITEHKATIVDRGR